MKRLKRILCAIFRHSRLVSSCLGYQHCARCGELLGDTLAGAYKVFVGISCGCEGCQQHYRELTFIDKFLAEKPEWLGKTPEQWKAEREEERQKVRRWIDAQRAKYP